MWREPQETPALARTGAPDDSLLGSVVLVVSSEPARADAIGAPLRDLGAQVRFLGLSDLGYLEAAAADPDLIAVDPMWLAIGGDMTRLRSNPRLRWASTWTVPWAEWTASEVGPLPRGRLREALQEELRPLAELREGLRRGRRTLRLEELGPARLLREVCRIGPAARVAIESGHAKARVQLLGDVCVSARFESRQGTERGIPALAAVLRLFEGQVSVEWAPPPAPVSLAIPLVKALAEASGYDIDLLEPDVNPSEPGPPTEQTVAVPGRGRWLRRVFAIAVLVGSASVGLYLSTYVGSLSNALSKDAQGGQGLGGYRAHGYDGAPGHVESDALSAESREEARAAPAGTRSTIGRPGPLAATGSDSPEEGRRRPPKPAAIPPVNPERGDTRSADLLLEPEDLAREAEATLEENDREWQLPSLDTVPNAQDRERSDHTVEHARTVLARGQERRATALFRRAAEEMPHNPHPYAELGRLALEDGYAQEGLTLAERAAHLRPRRKAYQLLVGDAWAALGDIDRARRAYRRAGWLPPFNDVATARVRELMAAVRRGNDS